VINRHRIWFISTVRVHHACSLVRPVIAVLIDATGSMSDVLNRAKRQVQMMMERTYEIMDEQNVRCAVEMQFVVYRNYSSKESSLLQYSTWESSSDNLRSFLESVTASGGQGNEAIEIAFAHVNNEIQLGKEVTQVILIGDMPPNTMKEVRTKREGSGGDSYWHTTKFAIPTYYEHELQRLIDAEVTVYAFYVNSGFPSILLNTSSEKTVREVFQSIVDKSGKGLCEELNVQSDEGGLRLTDLVTKAVLSNIGELSGGDAKERLLRAYIEKYTQGHQ